MDSIEPQGFFEVLANGASWVLSHWIFISLLLLFIFVRALSPDNLRAA